MSSLLSTPFRFKYMDSPEESLKAIEAHLAANPNDASAWNVRGVIEAQQEQFGDALRSFDQALSIDPNMGPAHSNRGRVLLALGPEKATEALKSFSRALELSPDDVRTLRDKAMSLRALGRSSEELECYTQISELAKSEWSVWLRKGDIELELGQFQSALESFEKALAIKGDLVPALIHRAIALALLDRFDEALKSAKKATKMEPKNIEAWLILGDVNIRAEKYKAALKALDTASGIDPTDASIENTIGMVYYKQGQLNDSIKHLRLAIGRKRKYPTALRNLGLILMELEEWNEALEPLEALASLVKNDPDIFDALATTYARLDDFCPAYDAWEKARKLYKKRGDNDEAERVTALGRASRINCSRQKKAIKAEREREKMTRRFTDRHELRRKKGK